MFRHITLNVYPLIPTAYIQIYPRARTKHIVYVGTPYGTKLNF